VSLFSIPRLEDHDALAVDDHLGVLGHGIIVEFPDAQRPPVSFPVAD
jgi:hypothetical protein